MGFYGNITNIARTQFQFDKIYPNRYEMDKKTNTDGVYIGRFVLIEYDTETDLESLIRVTKAPDGDYCLFHNTNIIIKKSDIDKGTVVYTASGPAQEGLPVTNCVFYKCTSNYVADSNEKATFERIDAKDTNDNYTNNYYIDSNTYQKGRGYDSTVWQKVYVDEKEKYVMIAELNTVVPTFDVVPEAPLPTPIAPHFDSNSTNVYYKLHWQAPWGFRIKEAIEGQKSDFDTTHTTYFYDPADDKIHSSNTNVNGAIYFNKDAFDAQVGKQHSIVKKDTQSKNEIKIEPTGKSGLKYASHDINSTLQEKEDIQELTINLPAIGNMMSDVWDIVHGPNRDNARTDENASLQGRLDSFTELPKNSIPVKRNSDGTIVGSYINGNANRQVTDILKEQLSTSAMSDDAWICTKINTDGLNNDTQVNGISIHHTFYATDDTTSSSNMNDSAKDTIDLYTPIVDKAGHVVGKNTETITLPYGFKTIATNGRATVESENATSTPYTNDVVAESTQDTLKINSGNKWIRIDLNNTTDAVNISHDVHNTTSSTSEDNLSSETDVTTFEVPTYAFDKAGHYVSHDTKTLTMPFGYGKIKGDDGETSATATFDELTFSSDDWLTATVEQDTVIYSHDYPKAEDDTTSTSDVNGNGDTIVLETLTRDEKGHVVKVNQNTVTLPYGYKTFTGDTGSSSAAETQDTMVINGDNWLKVDVTTDKVALSHIGPVSAVYTSKTNVEPKFGETFTVEDHYYDDHGHIYKTETHTVKIPAGSLSDAEASGADVITQLAFNADTGAISTKRTNISNLKLTDYSLGSNGTDIEATDLLGSALSKLQVQLHNCVDEITNEVNNRAEAEQSLQNQINLIMDNPETADVIDSIKEFTQYIESHGNIAEGIRTDINTNSAAIAEQKQQLNEFVNKVNPYLDTIDSYGDIVSHNASEFVLKEAYERKMSEVDSAIVGINQEAKRLTNENKAFAEQLETKVLKETYERKISELDAAIIGINQEAKRLTNENIALTAMVNDLLARLEVLENLNQPNE